MPLSPSPVGKLVADYFFENAPAPGTPITEVQLEALWTGAMGIIYDDIKATALVSTTDVVTIPVTSAPGTPSAGTGVGTGTVS